MNSLIPYNERDRLRALFACKILDTPREACFDKVTERAVEKFNVPTSAFGLVDSERYWVKASVGFGVQEMDRATALCAHVVGNNAPIVLEDAHKDRRFVDHPLVKSDPFIRFYAGIPIRADGGHAVGSFCIVDTVPRQLPWEEYLALQDLAKELENELHSRSAIKSSG